MAFPKELDFLEPRIQECIEKEGKEFLLGLIKLPDKQYETVLKYASALIKKEKLVYMREKNMIISVALVFFAIKDFQGNQFWDEFARKIDADEMQVQKICKPAFENFCKLNTFYFHVGRKNKGYVTSILTHAIIPKTSIDKFLEFLEDIYFKDLEEDYERSEVEQLVEYMHRLFSKFLEEDDIQLNIQGSKMTIARQQLPKAFRIAFVKSAGIVAPIIENYLFYMNELNYSRDISYSFNTRFDNYFKYYVNNISELRRVSTDKSTIAKKGIKKFTTAHFKFQKDLLHLIVPKQIIDSDYIKDKIYLNVYNDDKLVENRELKLTKSRLLFKTEEEIVLLNSFYKNLRYEIWTGDVTIFNSKEKLFRDYLIFNSDAEEVAANQLKSQRYKIVCSNQTELKVMNGDITSLKYPDRTIHTVFLKDDTILELSGYVITPNTKRLITEFSDKELYERVEGIGDHEESYLIYSEIPRLQLVISNDKTINDYVLSVNGNNYHLSQESRFSISTMTDGSGSQVAQILINNSLLQDLMNYSLAIREKGNMHPVISRNLCVIPQLNYSFDKHFYYKDKQAKLTNLNVGDALSCRETLPLKVNLKKYDHVAVKIEKTAIRLKIKIPKFSWHLGEYNSSQNVSDIWFKSVKEPQLKVTYTEDVSKIYLVSSNKMITLEGKKIANQKQFDLRDYFSVEHKSPVTIGVRLKDKQIPLVTTHYQPTLKNVKVDYYDTGRFNKGLFIQGAFVGEGNLKAQVLDIKESIIQEYDIKHSFNLFDPNVNLDMGKYRVRIILIEEDDFFGLSDDEKVLHEENLLVGDPFVIDTQKKVLKVKKCNTYDGEFLLDNFYLQNVRTSKIEGYYEADGFYYITDWDTQELRKRYFSTYNPFIMRLKKSNDYIYKLEIEDKDRDGLIFDIHSKHVNPKVVNNEERFKLIDTITIDKREVD